MKRTHQLLLVAVIAGTIALPAAAQVEYRNPGSPVPVVQTAPPPPPPGAPPAPPQYGQQYPVAPPVPSQGVQYPYAPPAVQTCSGCGVVDNIRVIEQAGEASGLGAVAGGLLGGLLGNQIGQGRGNTAATIVGVAGGAVAGHQVEKSTKRVQRFEISVRMDDGSMRSVTYDAEPGLRSGDRVRLIDGRFVRI